jgi:hypothetical protein
MRSSFSLTLLIVFLVVPSIASGENLKLGGSEMREEHRFGSADPQPAGAPSPKIAKIARVTVVGQADNPPAGEVFESVENTEAEGFVIFFGAGAALMVPYRVSDGAMDSRVLSEFSLSWAPFGIVGEIGADVAITRSSSFLFRPNLKFYFVKHDIFSLYLEGSCAIFSGPDDTHVGGGGALGLVFGVMEHLAVEFRAGGSAFSMSEQSSSALLDGAPYREGSEATPGLVLLPSVSARLMARF